MRIVLLTLLACLGTVPSLRAADLDLTGMDTPRDRKAAAVRIMEWAKSIGFDAALTADGEEVFVRDMKLTLRAVLNDVGVDRIIVFNSYRGKPGNASDPQVPVILGKVNGSQIAAKVSVDGDGDILFDTTLAFDNTLSPRLFRCFLEHSNKAADMLIQNHPELAALMK